MRRGGIAVVLLALVLLNGCGTIGNLFGRGDRRAAEEFIAADAQYKADSADYAAARGAMRAAWKAGTMKTEKWMEFRFAENAVAAATPAVAEDFSEWIRERKKPTRFDSHARTLRDAQAEVITLAKEFQ